MAPSYLSKSAALPSLGGERVWGLRCHTLRVVGSTLTLLGLAPQPNSLGFCPSLALMDLHLFLLLQWVRPQILSLSPILSYLSTPLLSLILFLHPLSETVGWPSLCLAAYTS